MPLLNNWLIFRYNLLCDLRFFFFWLFHGLFPDFWLAITVLITLRLAVDLSRHMDSRWKRILFMLAGSLGNQIFALRAGEILGVNRDSIDSRPLSVASRLGKS